MIEIGENCQLGNAQFKRYKTIKIGNSVKIGNGVVFDVTEYLEIGDRTIIGDNTKISGRYIKIGRECWIDENVFIGGGSCKERLSELIIGDLVHIGRNTTINTARKIVIGDEVGIGEDSKIYSHGAYLNYFDGFPVDFGPITIGNRVWLPKAIVMPNVTIGDNVVVGAGAVITKSLPSGCLAVGIPAKVIKENEYPKKYTDDEFLGLLNKFVEHFKKDIAPEPIEIRVYGKQVFINSSLTLFDFENQKIDGPVTELTELFRNELRRFGVRIRCYPDYESGIYKPW